MKLLNITNEPIPPRRAGRSEYNLAVSSILVGQCAEFSPQDYSNDQRGLLNAAKRNGLKITTRKTNKCTLKVWRIE